MAEPAARIPRGDGRQRRRDGRIQHLARARPGGVQPPVDEIFAAVRQRTAGIPEAVVYAHPQEGVDALAAAFPNAQGAPPGVKSRSGTGPAPSSAAD